MDVVIQTNCCAVCGSCVFYDRTEDFLLQLVMKTINEKQELLKSAHVLIRATFSKSFESYDIHVYKERKKYQATGLRNKRSGWSYGSVFICGVELTSDRQPPQHVVVRYSVSCTTCQRCSQCFSIEPLHQRDHMLGMQAERYLYVHSCEGQSVESTKSANRCCSQLSLGRKMNWQLAMQDIFSELGLCEMYSVASIKLSIANICKLVVPFFCPH